MLVANSSPFAFVYNLTNKLSWKINLPVANILRRLECFLYRRFFCFFSFFLRTHKSSSVLQRWHQYAQRRYVRMSLLLLHCYAHLLNVTLVQLEWQLFLLLLLMMMLNVVLHPRTKVKQNVFMVFSSNQKSSLM